jgi:hypothetical protein
MSKSLRNLWLCLMLFTLVGRQKVTADSCNPEEDSSSNGCECYIHYDNVAYEDDTGYIYQGTEHDFGNNDSISSSACEDWFYENITNGDEATNACAYFSPGNGEYSQAASARAAGAWYYDGVYQGEYTSSLYDCCDLGYCQPDPTCDYDWQYCDNVTYICCGDLQCDSSDNTCDEGG